MKKSLLLCGLLAASSMAMAGEYTCKVYCVTSGGSTEYTMASVQASSRSDAANIVDQQADKICRDAGYYKATSASMGASQCK